MPVGLIAWLVAVTAVVALGSSQLLYATGAYDSYSDALFEAALTTVTGSGITSSEGFPRVLHITLATYSVAVFATLAARHKRYAMTLNEVLVGQGVLLGVALTGGKAQVILNIGAAKQTGAEFSPAVMRIARLLQ